MENNAYKLAKDLGKELHISPGVAHQLLILAGNDPVLVKQASRQSRGLGECQARIIDTRIGQLEDDLYVYEDEEDQLREY